MSEKVYDVPADWAKRAFINDAKYKEMYARSVKDPDGFWGEHGKRIDWLKPYTKVRNVSFDPHDVSIKWFEDGVTNVAVNCVDRHLPKRAKQTAIIWEGDDPKQSKHITYAELAENVDVTARLPHDGLAGEQPQACSLALGLRREKRFKQMRFDFLRHPNPRVAQA